MATVKNYAERDDGAYTGLLRRLLAVKGGSEQLDFLSAVKVREKFVEFMDREAPRNEGETIDVFSKPLTEQSFKEMTRDQEQAAYGTWAHVPPRVACRVAFWAEVTVSHIRSGVISEAYWLAANGGRNESGAERIDRALTEKTVKGIDDCVRTVIRRMSGLPAARGNRSVFVNPSFGRAWWRERLVVRILGRSNAEACVSLLDVVRNSQQYWENLVTMIVSRGSVFGSVDVQDALVNGLAKHLRDMPNSPLKTASSLNAALRRFSNVAASRELGVLEFDEIGVIVDELLGRVANLRGNR